jgi:hypothetical protein
MSEEWTEEQRKAYAMASVDFKLNPMTEALEETRKPNQIVGVLLETQREIVHWMIKLEKSGICVRTNRDSLTFPNGSILVFFNASSEQLSEAVRGRNYSSFIYGGWPPDWRLAEYIAAHKRE